MRGFSGNKYLVFVNDQFSRTSFALAVTSRFAVSSRVQKLIVRVHKSFNYQLQAIQQDNGTEFTRLPRFCETFVITPKTSIPWRPQKNGAVERSIRVQI